MAESSAVGGWLLGEPSAAPVLDQLRRATSITMSVLMLIEVDRLLIRAVAEDRLSGDRADAQRGYFNETASRWTVLELSDEIVQRARQPFPVEPVRTLDAMHLATALVARRAVPDLAILTLDQRVRHNARELGFRVLPRLERS